MANPYGEIELFDSRLLRNLPDSVSEGFGERQQEAVAHIGEVATLRAVFGGEGDAATANAILDTLNGETSPELIVAGIQVGVTIADKDIKETFFSDYFNRIFQKIEHISQFSDSVEVASRRNRVLANIFIESMVAFSEEPTQKLRAIDNFTQRSKERDYEDYGAFRGDDKRAVFNHAATVEMEMIGDRFEPDYYETVVDIATSSVISNPELKEKAIRYVLAHVDKVPVLVGLKSMNKLAASASDPETIFNALEEAVKLLPRTPEVVQTAEDDVLEKQQILDEAKIHIPYLPLITKARRERWQQRQDAHKEANDAAIKASQNRNQIVSKERDSRAAVFAKPAQDILFFAAQERGQRIIEDLAASLDEETKHDFVEGLMDSLSREYKQFAHAKNEEQPTIIIDGETMDLRTQENIASVFTYLHQTFGVDWKSPQV